MEGWHNGRLAMEHATHFVGKMLMKKLERERERERALLGTMLHNGGSRAAPAEITDMHGRSLSACSSIK